MKTTTPFKPPAPSNPAPLPTLRVSLQDFGDAKLNRLAMAGAAFDKMEKGERERALRYFKSKYSAEWPSDQSY